jgi:hypothetical protein
MATNPTQAVEVKAWLKKNWVYVVGVASIISAAVAVVHLWPSSSAPAPGPNVIGGNCVQNGNNNSCTVQQIQQQAGELRNGNPQQQKNDIAKISQAEPKVPGPWPYFVYNTVNTGTGQDVGLKVKKAPSVRGEQVGSTPPGSLVWADCLVVNDYDPEVGSDVDVGPKWLRIHWPVDTPNTAYSTSSPQALFLEYVYAGYALPFTHNGNIPQCS